MKFYVHPINPHYGPTHADAYSEGWQFGVWEHPYPALEPSQYRVQSKDLQAAQDARNQTEAVTLHIADEPVKGEWLSLAPAVHPHSEAAARDTLHMAVRGTQPVLWPWTAA
jgi:hypothetical protein